MATLNDDCRKGLHPLTDILRVNEGFDIERVVRWCSSCGAIVVDGEHDGRIAPGRYRAMQLPSLTSLIKKETK